MSVRPRIDLEVLASRVAALEKAASISTPVSECRDVRTLQLALEQACRERDEYATESFKDWNRERLALLARVDSLRAERDAAVSALESRAGKGVPEVTTESGGPDDYPSVCINGEHVFQHSSVIEPRAAIALQAWLTAHWPAAPMEEDADKRVAEAVAREARILTTLAVTDVCDVINCSEMHRQWTSYTGDLRDRIIARLEARIPPLRAPASPAGEAPCERCGGNGVFREQRCPACNGSGRAAKVTGAQSEPDEGEASSRAVAPVAPGASPPPAAPDVDDVEKLVRVDLTQPLPIGGARIHVGDVSWWVQSNGEATSLAHRLRSALRPLLTAARAEARRVALEEAAKECEAYRLHAQATFIGTLADMQGHAMMAARDCACGIRALAEQGGGKT